jgi:hypothetical protein
MPPLPDTVNDETNGAVPSTPDIKMTDAETDAALQVTVNANDEKAVGSVDHNMDISQKQVPGYSR